MKNNDSSPDSKDLPPTKGLRSSGLDETSSGYPPPLHRFQPNSPERREEIEVLCNALARIMLKNPSLRLGQAVVNLTTFAGGRSVREVEDATLIAYLQRKLI